MPTPADEIASVTALGSVYSQWQEVEFERRIGSIVSHLRLRVMEITPPGTPAASTYSNLRLKPLDAPVSATLAGRLVMTDGVVSVRQVAYTAASHMIEIIAYSRTLDLPFGTVKPAQFKNVTLQQFANAITSASLTLSACSVSRQA